MSREYFNARHASGKSRGPGQRPEKRTNAAGLSWLFRYPNRTCVSPGSPSMLIGYPIAWVVEAMDQATTLTEET